jgi:hypothetical protein
MKKFFFGFLDKKWKRLSRTVWVTILAYTTLFIGPNLNDEELALMFSVTIVLPILVSYVLESFVINSDFEKGVNSEKDNLKIQTVPAEPKAISKEPKVLSKESKVVDTESKRGSSTFGSKLKSYFWYNGEYLSGNKYWLRKFLQWPLNIIFIGFYLRAVTTYARSKSLAISSAGSIMFSLYSIIIDFYVIFIFPFNDKLGFVSDDMLWVLILPVTPFAHLIFANGQSQSQEGKANHNALTGD